MSATPTTAMAIAMQYSPKASIVAVMKERHGESRAGGRAALAPFKVLPRFWKLILARDVRNGPARCRSQSGGLFREGLSIRGRLAGG